MSPIRRPNFRKKHQNGEIEVYSLGDVGVSFAPLDLFIEARNSTTENLTLLLGSRHSTSGG